MIGAVRTTGLNDANSTEFEPKTSDPVVYIMEAQRGKEGTGGSMRLGGYECVIKPSSLSQRVYGANKIIERHRHRYEVNQAYKSQIEEAGLLISGLSPDGTLVEMIEGKDHPYFLATQAHPEFLSRPMRPHPLFYGFIKASLKT